MRRAERDYTKISRVRWTALLAAAFTFSSVAAAQPTGDRAPQGTTHEAASAPAIADAGAGATTAPSPDAGPKPAASDQGDDEVVDLSGETDLVGPTDAGPSLPAKPAEPPPPPDKFEFRGFARVTGAAGLAPPAADPPGSAPQERVPYDRAFTEQHLYVDLRYARAKWFQAVASASLSFAAFYQENRPSSGAAGTSFAPQAFEATPREAYVAFTTGPLDLRLGQQRIVWGNSDFFTPNDILNGRDLRNPNVFDPEMLALPSPALRADVDLQLAVLSLVVEPFNVIDRIDLYGTNWALVQPDAPRSLRRLFGTLAQGQDRVSVAALQDAMTGGQLAPANVSNGSIGGSLRYKIGGLDVSHYFLSGFDRTPAVFIDPAFQAQLETLNADQLNGAVFEAVQNQARAANNAFGGPILVSFRRRAHVGMDAQTTVGPFVIRADAAYDSAKTFFTKASMNSIIRPALQEVVGIEYQTGSFDKVVGVEGWAMQLVGPPVLYVPSVTLQPSGDLLFYREQSFAAAAVARWLFLEHFIVDARSQVGVVPFSFLARVEGGWQTPGATVRLGAMGLGGEAGSLGSYFRRNTTVYATTRISF